MTRWYPCFAQITNFQSRDYQWWISEQSLSFLLLQHVLWVSAIKTALCNRNPSDCSLLLRFVFFACLHFFWNINNEFYDYSRSEFCSIAEEESPWPRAEKKCGMHPPSQSSQNITALLTTYLVVAGGKYILQIKKRHYYNSKLLAFCFAAFLHI